MEPFIQFKIPGLVVPKARPRFVKTSSGGHTYTTHRTSIYEREIAIMGSLQMGGHELLECPVKLDIIASFAVPKGYAKRLQGDLISRPYTGRVDWDNIGKIVSDALNGIVYTDDRLVTIGSVSKLYAYDHGLEVKIWRI
jgi:Holliday junction resolvase RusA-like endonuclease